MNFEDMVNRISPKLKAIAKKLNGRFTFFDEDDLYQEALIHLWQKCRDGEIMDKTDSYVLQGCFFFLKNYIRVAHKKIDSQSVSFATAVNNGDDTLADVIFAGSPDGEFSFIMVDTLVEDISSCLTQREKDVFFLSLESLTTREMGKRLGVSHPMVVKIKKRIREKCENLGLPN